MSLAQHLIGTGRITKQDLVTYCHSLAVAGEEQWGLNAFTRLHSRDFVLEQAEKEGPLAGMPISIKANLAVRETPLTASSKMLATDTACGYDAEVVRKLKDMGAVVIGITQMDEFGMGSLGTNLGEGNGGLTKNPLPYLASVTRTPDQWMKEIKKPYDTILDDHVTTDEVELWYAGGSSCGSAASVAHGSSMLSVASDTGGSIRLPAAWCGITGFKPSYGSLSRKGLVSYASSLDTVGFIAPSAECVAIVMENLACAQQADITDSTMTSKKTDTSNSNESSNFRVGIPSAFSVEDCPIEIQDAWTDAARGLEQSGATLVEIPSETISSDLIRTSLAAYYIIASAEASSNLSRYDGLRFGLGLSTDGTKHTMDELSLLERQYAATRSVGFGQEVLRRMLSGTSVLSSDRFHTHYEAASRIRAVVTKQMRHALETVDVLLTPTCLSMPNTTNIGLANDVLTVPVSLACLPAISIPFLIGTGAPVGLQIVGSSDDKVLEVAMALQHSRSAFSR